MILIVVNLIINSIVVAALITSGSGSGFGFGGTLRRLLVVTSIITTVLYLGYFAFMESTQGKTVGKMVMKLHVVGANGRKPDARGGRQAQHLAGLPDPGRDPVPRHRRRDPLAWSRSS